MVTLQQWETFTKEVDAITPDTSVLPWMWVAAKEGTEGDMERLPHWPEIIEVNETVWRDYYTGERLEEYARPWYGDHDARYGENENCLALYTDLPWEESWYELLCESYDKSCPCQYQQQPILRLRGVCWGLPLDTFYIPVQLRSPGSCTGV